MTDDYTAEDAEAGWQLELLFRRFGTSRMEKAIRGRAKKPGGRGRPARKGILNDPEVPYLVEMAHLAQQKEAIEPYSLAREVADKNRLRGDIVSNTKRLAKKFKEFQELAWRSLIWDKQMETFKLSAKIGELSRRWADYAHTPEGALVIADLEAMELELNQMRATLLRLKLVPLSRIHQHIGVPGEI